MGLETAALIALAGASAFQGYQSYEAGQETKKQARQQEQAATKLRADEERERLQATMRNQKRKGATGEPGTRDTILTSPLGLPGSPQTGPKTLLGA